MRIAVLGWGSLIWDPRELPREGTWQEGGPILPIEFSRISSDSRLTLVIDPKNGAAVPTRFVLSPRADVEDAVSDLRTREGTTVDRIGFVNLADGHHRCNADPSAREKIQDWARSKGFEAVVWTDLYPNFEKEHSRHLPFSVENAETYLRELPKGVAIRARKYIQNAPEEVDTPLRRRLRETKWLDC
jgi:hypothetical protein